MKVDPFFIKNFPKYHPIRLFFTAKAKLIDLEAKANFSRYMLPIKELLDLPDASNFNYNNTDVTPFQMQHILYAVNITEHLIDSVIVEVGCYRGVTTAAIASSTSRKVIAVDPYIGYGGSATDLAHFRNSTNHIDNVIHIKKTSGEAFRSWAYGPASLIFIDAVHDYVNTAFDIEAWSSLLIPRGIIMMHDTDLRQFAGTRKATFEYICKDDNILIAHPYNLTIIQKISN